MEADWNDKSIQKLKQGCLRAVSVAGRGVRTSRRSTDCLELDMRRTRDSSGTSRDGEEPGIENLGCRGFVVIVDDGAMKTGKRGKMDISYLIIGYILKWKIDREVTNMRN